MTNTEKAKKLYNEFKNEYRFAGFNQSAFKQRLRRLATQVGQDEYDAWMYLKVIETRLEMSLSFDKRK